MDRVDYDLNNYFNDLESDDLGDDLLGYEDDLHDLQDELNKLPAPPRSAEAIMQSLREDSERMDRVNQQLEMLARQYKL